jgi:hypothetical protein
VGERRTLKIGRRLRASLDAAGVIPGTDTGRRIAAVLRALTTDEELPRAGDVEVAISPVARAHVRRVVGANLWVWYEDRGAFVLALLVSRDPPVPIA